MNDMLEVKFFARLDLEPITYFWIDTSWQSAYGKNGGIVKTTRGKGTTGSPIKALVTH